jgi:FtsP/CotA-like multicopper oxidase with cupredoxin domain
MLMFIIIAGALFLRFRGAHKVPGHAAITASGWAGVDGAGTVNSGAAPVDAAVGPETGATPGDAATATAMADAGEPAATVDTEQARPADKSTEDGE